MKPLFTFLLLLIITITCHAQESFQSPFRKGSYTRLGLQMIGNDVDQRLSVRDNILKSNFGARQGLVFEKGRIFYFLPKTPKSIVNVGLDWTIVSLSYNPSKKSWQNYVDKTTSTTDEVSAPMVISGSSKLGPVVSINPFDKLVIDLRGQISAGAYLFGPIYRDDAANYTYDPYNSVDGKWTDMASYSIRPNVGATLRYGAIGLAFDYAPGKNKFTYTETVANVSTVKTATLATNTMQAKISFSLKK